MKTIDKLKHEGALYRVNGIMECLDKKQISREESNALLWLVNDSIIVMGRKVSDYAFAALDILGIKKYNGNEKDVKLLIKDMRS